ncbi:MAG: hypothetical protein ACRDS9_21955 [Pseudonocardiaceae bacterium]
MSRVGPAQGRRFWLVPDGGAVVGLRWGTRVRKDRTGPGATDGTVMPYQPEYSQGRFPVRFDDGLWEVLNPSDVTVLAAPKEGTV